MHGNVWEWVHDWYWSDYYNFSADKDPTGPASGSGRVVRGGDFRVGAEDQRSARRFGFPQSSRFDVVGARLLMGSPIATGKPQLRVSPSDLSTGPVVVDQELLLNNAGTGRLDWTVREDEGWMEVRSDLGTTAGDGSLSGTGDVVLTVHAYEADLNGERRGLIQVSSNGGVVDVPITVHGDVPARILETLVADLPGGGTMDFVWIDPGTFTMGAPDAEGGFANESPQHLVEISRGFFIGRTEVTQEQWEMTRGTRPWALKDGVEIGPDYPVSYVNWIDVQGFILQLNEDIGESVYRLPTEAEWEYAARAGSTTPWFFGEDETQMSTYAWFGNSVDAPQPVGLKQPNPWGLFDVHGNVWEWVQDWFGEDYYMQSPLLDPAGPASGSRRVMRGGDYRIGARSMRVARRFSYSPSTKLNIIGFRLVLGRGIPELQVAPEEFSVVGRPFQSELELRNVGSGDLQWSVSEQVPWLVVSSGEGDTGNTGLLSGTGGVDLVVHTSGVGLDEGIWQGEIQLSTTGGDRTVLVSMRVRNAIVVPLPGGATMEFVWIDPGTFLMGSPEIEIGRNADEGPLREVEISQGFYLGRFEITQGQWISAMGTRSWLGQSLVREDPDHPATYISWDDLQNLIQTLDDFEGEPLYRLPTEAEWEFAARAGVQSRWSFGEDASDLDAYAWYHRNAFDLVRHAPAVGTRLPNPWELYDMHGNVWEWVEDFYQADYYESGVRIDPPGPEDGTGRVIRGGAFFDLPRDLRAARRPGYMSQRGFGPGVGGRLVRIR